MADPTEAAPAEGDQAPKKDWRKELEDRATAAETAQVEMAQELALFKSGLVDLSDDQREDVLTLAKAKGDTSPEALRATAERLSYVQPPETAAPSPEEAQVQAEVAGMTALAGSPAQIPAPDAGEFKLDQFNSPTELFNALRGTIPEDFGPELPGR